MSDKLNDVLEALRRIDNQGDLNVIADAWRRQQTFIGNKNRTGLKRGDKIEWEYGGLTKQGTIIKMNRKTVEVQDLAQATPFGRTVTKINASMIKRKVEG
jgi:hypothetical protein